MWLFLFLLLVPTQLGRHFWPDWSYVLGIRIDYLSPTLYLLDLIWLILFFLNLRNFKFKKKFFLNFKFFLVLGFVVINVLMAVSPILAIYKWLRIGQVYLTWIFLRKNKILVRENLVKVIPFWVIFESLLAVAQLSMDGSLGGIFWLFGERTFNFNTIGIAQMSVLGEGVIRAYGTFSHPNSLAGFLLVVLLLWYWLRGKINKTWWWVVFWLGLVGVLVSGSRTIWILSLTLILVVIFKNIENEKNIVGFGILFLSVMVFVLKGVSMEYQVSDFLGGWDKDGINKRIQLNVAGLKMVESSPWFGVGLGNFLTRLPEFQKNNGIFWLQPVHNILILMVSEIGILGLSLVFLFFNKNFIWGKILPIFKIIFGVVLISGMIDHYWLTLPQNVWLLVLVLAMA